MTDTLKRTPLYDLHVAAGARIVPFGGWAMPVQYTGVIEEHRAVRSRVGLFDVSHMGEVEIRGPRALTAANRLLTNDVARLADGQACYTAMLKEDGGIVDDLVAYRFSPERIFICVNAANRAKDFEWMRSVAGEDAEVTDESDAYAQIAVQGPRAVELVSRLTRAPVGDLGSYWFREAEVAGRRAIVSRTGYTGEDGFELYVASRDGPPLWEALIERGRDLGVMPIGLGARDSLRLEMKYALYGNDVDESTNPLEAGLGWIVKLDKPDFVGKAALLAIRASGGPARRLAGFEMTGRGIARHGYPALSEGQRIGTVTSGTFGPSVDKAIGMAYVPAALATVGSALEVEIRGKRVPARVTKTPFYTRRAA